MFFCAKNMAIRPIMGGTRAVGQFESIWGEMRLRRFFCHRKHSNTVCCMIYATVNTSLSNGRLCDTVIHPASVNPVSVRRVSDGHGNRNLHGSPAPIANRPSAADHKKRPAFSCKTSILLPQKANQA
jgi:hypothetical protein